MRISNRSIVMLACRERMRRFGVMSPCIALSRIFTISRGCGGFSVGWFSMIGFGRGVGSGTDGFAVFRAGGGGSSVGWFSVMGFGRVGSRGGFAVFDRCAGSSGTGGGSAGGR